MAMEAAEPETGVRICAAARSISRHDHARAPRFPETTAPGRGRDPPTTGRRLVIPYRHGSHTATERANGIWKRLLAEAVPPALDPPVLEALDAFVARRKREIGGGPA